ncbi:MAG: tRNA (adenosine(37)-N6)-dimethylallyltransferase MiaA [bacterium]|nr:tRNA (adenosine(37)-N6)-dimethylallyltransferase MiaA [bacterium]
MSETRKIVHILGPTGVGKSRTAIQLARKIGGEIISADSAQVYKDFDIGTDKLGKDQQGNIPHYLIDIFPHCSQFNASIFLSRSFERSEDIVNRGKVPIVCGGTALYLKTMIHGIFPESQDKRVTRDQLNRIVQRRGLASLYRKLETVDPSYARKIGENDRIRIVRAMEIFYNNQMPPSEIFRQTQTPFKDYQFIRVGLNTHREELYKRIETRVDRMMQRGLLEEVKRLREKYPPSCPPFKSLGYKEILMHLDREDFPLEEAVALIKQHSRNFAKRQLSWFRRETDIQWFEPGQADQIENHVLKRLKKE